MKTLRAIANLPSYVREYSFRALRGLYRDWRYGYTSYDEFLDFIIWH